MEPEFREAFTLALKFLDDPEVTGVDIGLKMVQGRCLNDLALRVHVRTKKPSNQLDPMQRIPRRISGIFTDVVEACYQTHHANRTSRGNPIQPGLSVSNRYCESGTIGAILKSTTVGQEENLYLLSNSHVLCHSSQCDEIIQPGKSDQGQDVIAHLYDSFLDIEGDAAIARILKDRCSVEKCQLESDVFVHDAADPQINMILEKSGRSTSLTQGQIDGEGTYKIDRSGTIQLMKGFRLGSLDGQAICAGGDSGSVWYVPENETDSNRKKGTGIGLHVAGRGPVAVACKLTTVLSRLKLKIAG